MHFLREQFRALGGATGPAPESCKTPFGAVLPRQLTESIKSTKLFVLDIRFDIEKDLKPAFV